MLTEHALHCRASLGRAAAREAIDTALEPFYDDITATAYAASVTNIDGMAVTTTTIRQAFDFAIAGEIDVSVTPDLLSIELFNPYVKLYFDGERLVTKTETTSETWERVTDQKFDVLSTFSASKWACTTTDATAQAWAYQAGDKLFSEGDGVAFEAGTTATVASIDLTAYKGNYHVGYCEPYGCGTDRGFESTIVRLAAATVGGEVTLAFDPPRFQVSPSVHGTPSVALRLLRAVRNLAPSPEP